MGTDLGDADGALVSGDAHVALVSGDGHGALVSRDGRGAGDPDTEEAVVFARSVLVSSRHGKCHERRERCSCKC